VHQRSTNVRGDFVQIVLDDVDVGGQTERDADAWFHEIHNYQPDESGRCRNDLEIKIALIPIARLFERACAGDPSHNRGKNQRCDDRLDEVNENVAEKINFVSQSDASQRDQDADDHIRHDLRREDGGYQGRGFVDETTESIDQRLSRSQETKKDFLYGFL